MKAAKVPTEAKIKYSDGDEVTLEQDVAIRNPEEQEPKLAIEFIENGQIKNAEIKNFGILKEVTMIGVTISGDDIDGLGRIIIGGIDGYATVPENLDLETSYNIDATITYRNGVEYNVSTENSN